MKHPESMAQQLEAISLASIMVDNMTKSDCFKLALKYLENDKKMDKILLRRLLGQLDVMKCFIDKQDRVFKRLHAGVWEIEL